MTLSRDPMVLVAGTNPGAGTTYVTAVLGGLSAAEQPTHIVDMSDSPDLELLLRPNYDCVRPSYAFAGDLHRTPLDVVTAAIDARLKPGRPPHTALTIVTTSSLNWEARRVLEARSSLRVLVMEASTRGSDATLKWLSTTPSMPTLILVNELPNGNAGKHGRMAIGQVQDGLPAPVDLLPIRRASAIRGTFEDERPPLERIRKHPMLADYSTAWDWIQSGAVTHSGA